MFINRICCNRVDFNYDLELKDNIVIVKGDYGIEKEELNTFIHCDSIINKKNIWRIDCLHNQIDIGRVIDLVEEHLIVIFNGDILLSKEHREKIASDTSNQYLIFANSINEFPNANYQIAEMVIHDKKLTLEYLSLDNK